MNKKNNSYPKSLFRQEVLEYLQTPQFGKVLNNNQKIINTLIKIIFSAVICFLGVTILFCHQIITFASHLVN